MGLELCWFTGFYPRSGLVKRSAHRRTARASVVSRLWSLAFTRRFPGRGAAKSTPSTAVFPPPSPDSQGIIEHLYYVEN